MLTLGLLIAHSVVQARSDDVTVPPALERLFECVLRAAAHDSLDPTAPAEVIARRAWEGCRREAQNARAFYEELAPLAWGTSADTAENRHRFVQEGVERIEANVMEAAIEAVRLVREQRTRPAQDR